MACLYCGGEVPIRMRLTGEARFCSPEHKRLYNEEHSRLGLERLLEEFSSKAKPAEAPPIPEPETAEQPVSTLPEPELVYSGRDLRLWTYAPLPYRFSAKFDDFLSLDVAPAPYAAGKRSIAAASGAAVSIPAPVEPPAKPKPVETAGSDGSLSSGRFALTTDSPEAASAVKSAPPAPVSPPETPRTIPVAQPKPAAPSETVSQTPQPVHEQKPALVQAPSFGYAQKEEKESSGESGGQTWKIAAGVLLAVALGAGGYWGFGVSGQNAGGDTSEMEVAAANWDQWIPGWSEAVVGEEIALFSPSQQWSDYRVQWLAEPSEKVAWVYRATDPRNYHALLLEKDPQAGWKLIRYTVVEGRRTAQTETPLNLRPPDGERMSVELEVKGSRFTLFLEGHNVAEWSDNRLDRGGFGVIRPDLGLAGVGDLKVTQLNRESASRSHFWKGGAPLRLPEVTLLRRAGEPARSDESAGESNL